jgi:hypothetical protein
MFRPRGAKSAATPCSAAPLLLPGCACGAAAAPLGLLTSCRTQPCADAPWAPGLVPITPDLDTTRAAENFEAADRRDENAAAPHFQQELATRSALQRRRRSCDEGYRVPRHRAGAPILSREAEARIAPGRPQTEAATTSVMNLLPRRRRWRPRTAVGHVSLRSDGFVAGNHFQQLKVRSRTARRSAAGAIPEPSGAAPAGWAGLLGLRAT